MPFVTISIFIRELNYILKIAVINKTKQKQIHKSRIRNLCIFQNFVTGQVYQNKLSNI